MRYGRDLGCRYNSVPHDMRIIHENPQYKFERCGICNRSFKWKKGYKGRIDNAEYLKAHVRQFCQSFGVTKRIYMRLYKPNKTIISI